MQNSSQICDHRTQSWWWKILQYKTLKKIIWNVSLQNPIPSLRSPEPIMNRNSRIHTTFAKLIIAWRRKMGLRGIKLSNTVFHFERRKDGRSLFLTRNFHPTRWEYGTDSLLTKKWAGLISPNSISWPNEQIEQNAHWFSVWFLSMYFLDACIAWVD